MIGVMRCCWWQGMILPQRLASLLASLSPRFAGRLLLCQNLLRLCERFTGGQMVVVCNERHRIACVLAICNGCGCRHWRRSGDSASRRRGDRHQGKDYFELLRLRRLLR